MKKTTLFGKVKWKELFLTNVSAKNTASAHYTTIELLWQLSSVTNQKHSLMATLQQWTQTYRDDHDPREVLVALAKTRRLETTTHTVPAFVKTISREEALRHWEEEQLAKKMEPQPSISP